MRQKLSLILTTLLLLSSIPSTVFAIEAETVNNLVIDVNEDLTGLVNYTIDIKNNYQDNYVAKFKVTLPFPGATQIAPSARGINLPYTSSVNGSYTSIEVDLAGLDFRPFTSEQLQIQFRSNQLFKRSYGYNIFQYDSIFPSNNLDKFQISIKVPNNWGKAVYSTNNISASTNATKQEYSYRLDGRNLLIIWGQATTLGLKSEFSVNSPTNGNFLVSVPRNLSTQLVSWEQFGENVSGFYDDKKNEFASFAINAGENQIAFTGDVVLNSSIAISDFDGFAVASATTWSGALPEVTNSQTPVVKLQAIYKYVLNKFTPLPARQLDRNYLFTPNQSIQRTPVEYCQLMTALAGKYNIPSRLNYGVQLFPIGKDMNTNKPHIWCEFQIDQGIFLADPYLEDLTGHEFLTMNRVGKIVFGNFQIEQENYPVFGILNSSTQPLPTVTQIIPAENNEQQLTISDIYAIDNNTLGINIDNFGRSTFPIYTVEVNSEIAPISSNNNLRPLVLPKSANHIIVSGIEKYAGGDLQLKIVAQDQELFADFGKTGWHQIESESINTEVTPIILIALAIIVLSVLAFLAFKDKHLRRKLLGR